MSKTIADRFVEALEQLEQSRDADHISRLFSSNAEVGNVIAPEKFHGREGALDFWTKYRGTFEGIRSTFRNRIVEDGRIALEWTTEGTSSGGSKVQYDGVSILEVANDEITRFRAYFDAGALGRQIETPDTKVVHQ